MCHFLAPAGQPEMMHKNFMHRHLRIFVVRYSCMKFYTWFLRKRKLPYGNTACQNTSIAEIGLGGPASKPAETAVFSAKREGAAYRSWG